VSLYDVLLFLHVLGAFSLVAGTTAMAPFALGVGAPALGRDSTAKLALLGAGMSVAGALLTLVLGLWLVGNVGYSFFRFWVLGALVLWAIAGYSNGEVARTARAVHKGDGGGRDVRIVWVVDMLGAILLLVLMVWKPGH
jgi:hypothetical protein